MRVVHEHVAAHDERNFFLDMVVGMVAASRRVARFSAAREPWKLGSLEEDGDGDDAFGFFVLGVISFSRRVLAHVEAARSAPGAVEGEAEERLRDLLL